MAYFTSRCMTLLPQILSPYFRLLCNSVAAPLRSNSPPTAVAGLFGFSSMKMFSPPVSSLSIGGMPIDVKLVRPLTLLSRFAMMVLGMGVGVDVAVPVLAEPASEPGPARPLTPAPVTGLAPDRGRGGSGASRPQRDTDPLREMLVGKVSLSGRAAGVSATDTPLPHPRESYEGKAGASGAGEFHSRPEKNDRIVLADLMLTPLRSGDEPAWASDDRDGDR